MSKFHNQIFISFVVDAIPKHYFQAGLLLLSLEYFAKHPKENILVQCVNRVDKKFIHFLEKNGYRYRLIEPYLDGKYCNKLQQLEAFIGKKCDGVFLLDTDMFVLEPLLSMKNHCFAAKIVDAPNPPLPVIRRIFNAANIVLPEIVDSDWKLDNNTTIATNFNGGLYFIPSQIIEDINKKWKKWASWLYSKPELFDNDQQRIHVDQVSMAISLADSHIEYSPLSANYNFPIHLQETLCSYSPQEPIIILHYHNLITRFGLLDKTRISNLKAIKAIETANHAISKTQHFEFFDDYKRSCIKPVVQTLRSIQFAKQLTELTSPIKRKLKLILHAGTPKSGTTSLQFFMDKHQSKLLENGILYPDHYYNVVPPKHQWLVNDLLQSNPEKLLNNFETVLSNVEENTHTIFLSTEGIFNHWWDFPAQSKALLVELNSCFDVTLWVWLRDPLSFAESYYKQNIKNPRVPNVSCYGKDLSFNEMLKDDWFNRHLDYLGFLLECEALFGTNNVKSFDYDGDIIHAVCNKLGLATPANEMEIHNNKGLSAASINMLRVINRYSLSPAEKQQTMLHINKLNEILSKHSTESLIDAESRKELLEMTALVQNR